MPKDRKESDSSEIPSLTDEVRKVQDKISRLESQDGKSTKEAAASIISEVMGDNFRYREEKRKRDAEAEGKVLVDEKDWNRISNLLGEDESVSDFVKRAKVAFEGIGEAEKLTKRLHNMEMAKIAKCDGTVLNDLVTRDNVTLVKSEDGKVVVLHGKDGKDRTEIGEYAKEHWEHYAPALGLGQGTDSRRFIEQHQRSSENVGTETEEAAYSRFANSPEANFI